MAYQDCIDCGKYCDRRAQRCHQCYIKYLKLTKGNPLFGQKGKNNLNYKHGKTLIKSVCIACGKQLSKYAYYYNIEHCMSCACKHKLKNSINHPNYIEGLDRKYPIEFNNTLKLEIRQRDNFICQNCDMTEEEHLSVYGRVLDIHHIDYDKKNLNKDNLISLCQGCNVRANFNRVYWKQYYKEKIYEL